MKISVATPLLPSLQYHIVNPKGLVIAVLAQYGVMPLAAFCLAKVGIADRMYLETLIISLIIAIIAIFMLLNIFGIIYAFMSRL